MLGKLAARKSYLFGLVFVASAAALGIGLWSIVSSLTQGVDLPQEGSLKEIVSDSRPLDYEDLPDLVAEKPADKRFRGPPPVRLVVPRIHVDAPVLTMGLDADLIPEVPDTGYQIAYYDFTPRPGKGSNAVFSGHVDWFSYGQPVPGVFFRLRELQLGDLVRVYLKDGTRLRYVVSANVGVNYTDPNVLRVMDGTDKDVITLITCGGTWLPDPSLDFGGTYSHRVIVRAERVYGSAASFDGN